jgi:hypothetical protein
LRAIATGILGHDSATYFIEQNATKNDLQKLSSSEHPILRAIAINAVIKRKLVNQNDWILSHLDDTAWITTDDGEWGFGHYRIADYMLGTVVWESEEDRQQIIDEVLLNHNQLRAAYLVLDRSKPDDKFYSTVKEMASRRERRFDELEHAIFALASFQKKENNDNLMAIMMEHEYSLTSRSYALTEEYPNSRYPLVLEEHLKSKKRFFIYDRWNEIDDYIQAVASYKNDNSVRIFTKMLDWLDNLKCYIKSERIKQVMMNALFEYRCDKYSELIKRLRPLLPEKRIEISKSNKFIDGYKPSCTWPSLIEYHYMSN